MGSFAYDADTGEEFFVEDEIDEAVTAAREEHQEQAVLDLAARLEAVFSHEELAAIEELWDAAGYDFTGTVEAGGSEDVDELLAEREQELREAQEQDVELDEMVRARVKEHYGRSLTDAELASLGRHAEQQHPIDDWKPEHKLDTAEQRGEYYARLLGDREEHEPHRYTDDEIEKLTPHEALLARIAGDAEFEEDEDGEQVLAINGVDEDDEPDLSTHRARMQHYTERMEPNDEWDWSR